MRVVLAFSGYVVCHTLITIHTYYNTDSFLQALSVGFAYSSYRIVVGVGYFVHQWNIRVRDLSDILYVSPNTLLYHLSRTHSILYSLTYSPYFETFR